MADNDKKKLTDTIGKIAKTAKAASNIVDKGEKAVKKSTSNGLKKTTVKANPSVAAKKASTGANKATAATKKTTTAKTSQKPEKTVLEDVQSMTDSTVADAKYLGDSVKGVFGAFADDNDTNSKDNDKTKNIFSSVKNLAETTDDLQKSSKKRKTTAKKAKKKVKKSSKIQIAIVSIAIVLTLSVVMVYVISPDTFYRGYDTVAGWFKSDGYGGDYGMFYNEEGSLEVYFIDVGQGDSIFIRFPNNQTMLIDGGENRKHVEDSIKTVMSKLEVKYIDYVMLTHTDSDHVGSLDYIVNNYEVGAFFIPAVIPSHKLENKDSVKGSISTKAYYDFYTMAMTETYAKDGKTEKSQINKNQGVITIIENNSLKMTAYCPDENFYSNITNKSSALDKNNMSPICILEFAGKKICLTGDADEDAEIRFMNDAKNNIDVDILKAGHHGSDTSTNEAFFNFVTPEHTVISVGAGNSYKHPKQSVLDRLTSANNAIYRTDLNGTVKLTITGTGEISFDTAKAA